MNLSRKTEWEERFTYRDSKLQYPAQGQEAKRPLESRAKLEVYIKSKVWLEISLDAKGLGQPARGPGHMGTATPQAFPGLIKVHMKMGSNITSWY